LQKKRCTSARRKLREEAFALFWFGSAGEPSADQAIEMKLNIKPSLKFFAL